MLTTTTAHPRRCFRTPQTIPILAVVALGLGGAAAYIGRLANGSHVVYVLPLPFFAFLVDESLDIL
jgi:hypothetical protein